MLNKLLVVLAILVFNFSYAQNKDVRIELHNRALYDVYVTKNGKDYNLTNFAQWENIEDLKISFDKKYFFFRHKPAKGKSYRLALYNFKNLNKFVEMTPGFGGVFEWNGLNQIIHTWGCGTNCTNLRIYDINLKKIFFSLSSGGFKLSPKKDIVIQYSMRGNKFWLFDLRTLKNGILKGFAGTIGSTSIGNKLKYDLWSLEFHKDYSFRISPPRDSVYANTLDYEIDKIKLVNLKPKDTKEFYLRNFPFTK